MRSKLLKQILLAISFSITTPLALSHGSLEPEHGGIVKEAHDMVFELVRSKGNVEVYVRDHGKPVDSEQLTGSIMVLASGKKQEAQLIATGANKMTAGINVPEGAKVLLKVKSDGHHSVTVRYSL